MAGKVREQTGSKGDPYPPTQSPASAGVQELILVLCSETIPGWAGKPWRALNGNGVRGEPSCLQSYFSGTYRPREVAQGSEHLPCPGFGLAGKAGVDRCKQGFLEV